MNFINNIANSWEEWKKVHIPTLKPVEQQALVNLDRKFGDFVLQTDTPSATLAHPNLNKKFATFNSLTNPTYIPNVEVSPQVRENITSRFQTFVRSIPQTINTAGQQALNTAYPQAESKWPEGLNVPYKIAQTSGQFLKGQLSPMLERATVNAGPEMTTFISKFGKPKTPEEQQLAQKGLEEMGMAGAFALSTPRAISRNTAVDRITSALKQAGPLEKEQAGIYSKIRSREAGAISGIGKEMGGEQTYFKQLGQLKGEMPKVQFESIRNQITQPDIDSLFNDVEKSNLLPFDKITAKSGLSKLLGAEGGSVPVESEIKLLNRVFPPEFIETVLNKKPLMERMWGVGENLLNLPKAMVSTMDMSATLRQGAFIAPSHPKEWGSAFINQFKYFFSEDAYRGLVEEIERRPNYPLMKEAKLALTAGETQLASREEAFMSTLPERMPLFGKIYKASNRAYSGFLTKLRVDVFDSLINDAVERGLVKDNPKLVNDIAKFVNAATGRGTLPKALEGAAPLLNGVIFSPRLTASRLNLLNPVYYARLDPFVRKQALKSLFTFTGTVLTTLGLAKLAGAEVGTDPRSTDFGKIKIGNTRYDITAGYQQLVVLAARLITNQTVSSTTGKEYQLGTGYKPTTRLDILWRYFAGKESPMASFATDLLSGQTFMGEPVNVPAEIADMFIPFILQDMYDLYRQDPVNGIFKAIPGWFGVGVQTYGENIPLQGTTAGGKPNIQWRQPPSLGENIINTVTGTRLSNIPVEQWESLRKVKEAKQMLQTEKDRIKREVLETGLPQVTATGENIYLKNGVVTTSEEEKPSLLDRILGVKKAGAAEETPAVAKTTDFNLSQILSQSARESSARNIVKGWLATGMSEEEVVKTAKGLGYSEEEVDAATTSIIRSLSVEDRAKYVISQMNQSTDKQTTFTDMVNDEIMTSAIVDTWEKQKKINEAQAKTLKAQIKAITTTKVTGGGRKGIAARMPSLTRATPKSMTIKPIRIKPLVPAKMLKIKKIPFKKIVIPKIKLRVR